MTLPSSPVLFISVQQLISKTQSIGGGGLRTLGPEDTQDIILGDEDDLGRSTLLVRGICDNASILHQSDLDYLAQGNDVRWCFVWLYEVRCLGLRHEVLGSVF